MAYYTYTIKDHSDELSVVRFPVDEPDPDGSNWGTWLARMDTIRLAIAALSIGTIYKQQATVAEQILDPTRPSDADAQRESGLRLFWQETSFPFSKGHVTIACPDKPLIATPGTDQVDTVGITVVNALVALIEANWLSQNGNNVEVQSAYLVGRKN